MSVSGSDVSQLIDELDSEFEKLKNVKSTSVVLFVVGWQGSLVEMNDMKWKWTVFTVFR